MIDNCPKTYTLTERKAQDSTEVTQFSGCLSSGRDTGGHENSLLTQVQGQGNKTWEA